MKNKLLFEITVSVLLVIIPTAGVFWYLKGVPSFWNVQDIWSVVLGLGWVVVSVGYFHQGWLVRSGTPAKDVSLVLPSAVFVVQCVLFVKGIYYDDWSLIWGALVVNSGVFFSVYHILRARRNL